MSVQISLCKGYTMICLESLPVGKLGVNLGVICCSRLNLVMSNLDLSVDLSVEWIFLFHSFHQTLS